MKTKNQFSLTFSVIAVALCLHSAFAADKTKPTLTITAPKASARLTNATLTVAGTARDNISVSNVFVNLNGGEWSLATTANKFTNWTAPMTLTPGANKIKACASDAAGNKTTNEVNVTFVLNTTMKVVVVGPGKVIATPGGSLLAGTNSVTQEIGKSVSFSAVAAIGGQFVKWQGATNATKSAVAVIMASNLVLQAEFKDIGKPTLTIKSPAATSVTTSSHVTVTGTATDNLAVAQVFGSLDGINWTPATSADGFKNWTAAFDLTPGANTLRFFARDAAGNSSTTNQIKVTYKLSGPLIVIIDGPGKVTATPGGTLTAKTNTITEELGATVSLMAAPGAGARFVNWEGLTNTTAASARFTMTAGAIMRAHFIDNTKPTIAIKSPANNASLASSAVTVSGAASDNASVASVMISINGDDFTPANGTSNWAADVSLLPGPNTIRAFATDASGNHSTTNSIAVTVTAGLAEVYWPMNDGDIHWYTHNDGMEFNSLNNGRFRVTPPNTSLVSMTYSYNSDRSKALMEEMYYEITLPFSPALPHFDAANLKNGGTTSYHSTAYYQGVPIAVTLTVTVTKAGTVSVPAGTYSDCRDHFTRMTLAANGRSTSVPLFHFILAPRVGAIRMAIMDDSGVIQYWEELTGGHIDGVDISQIHLAEVPKIAHTTGGQKVMEAIRQLVTASKASIPALNVLSNSDANLQLQWTSDSQFTLESSNSIGADAAWQPVTIAPAVDGAVKTVTIPADTAARFYRLRSE